MAHIYLLEWIQVKRAQYFRIQKKLSLARQQSMGCVAYDSEAKGGTLMVLLSWNRREAFDQYNRSALTLATVKAGLSRPSIKSWSITGEGGSKMAFQLYRKAGQGLAEEFSSS